MIPQDILKVIYQYVGDIKQMVELSTINKETYKDLTMKDFWTGYCNINNILLINDDVNYKTPIEWYKEIDDNIYVKKLLIIMIVLKQIQNNVNGFIKEVILKVKDVVNQIVKGVSFALCVLRDHQLIIVKGSNL